MLATSDNKRRVSANCILNVVLQMCLECELKSKIVYHLLRVDSKSFVFALNRI